MSTNTETATNSEKVATLAPPSNTTTGGQSDLKVEGQSHPRSPTPFQEIPGSSREESMNDEADRRGVTPPPDPANLGGDPGTKLCKEGKHHYEMRHGVMGILMAIALFPCGLICYLRDKERVCVRCGVHA